MNKNSYDDFFNDVTFKSSIGNIKSLFMSDGSMATLLDIERMLDQADLYAFRNWILGEVVAGPVVKKYSVSVMLQYPYRMMPDPKGAKRLLAIGCKVKFKKTKIKVPVAVKTQDDFVEGTHYPKQMAKRVWLIMIEIPKDLVTTSREGSVEIAGKDIDLQELDDAYDQDLDSMIQADDEQNPNQQPQGGMQ